MADDSATDAAIEAKMEQVDWVPLESNPDVLTEFARKVGLPEDWGFCDVFGTDPELLCMVPQPCKALTFLYGCTEALYDSRRAAEAKVEADGQKLSDGLVYLKQYVGNACGTIACIHVMANNAESLGVAADAPLSRFLGSIRGKTPHEAGALLADATELHSASEGAAQGGQTEAPEASADTDAHFVAFVEKDGDVYELDGRKKFPINHGPAGDDFLLAATKAIKAAYMDKDPDNVRMNIMALSKLS